MKKIITALLIPVSVCVAAQQPLQQSLDSLRNVLAERVKNDTSLASLSVGILYGEHPLTWHFGKILPVESSAYEIGSITKTFTSLVLANAVKEGRAALNDDIRKYLPGSYPGLVYKGHPVRLIHLANTTSGLPDNLPDSCYRDKQTLFHALAGLTPDTIPGTVSRHSNVAATLLACILEEIYKEPVASLIRRYVLLPLKMTHTGFPGEDQPANLMKGYRESGREAPYLSNQILAGTGAMRSTAADMLRYLHFLLQAPSPESRIALTPSVLLDAVTNKQTAYAASVDSVNDRLYAVALNWMLYHPAPGKLRIWTDGGTYGFRSYIVLYPEARLAMVFLSNRTGKTVIDKEVKMAEAILATILANR